MRIDLITGFLGSGKTTFLKTYVRRLIDRGERVGIIENDYGAVNVDVMLLSELSELGCEIETIAGGCDADCHRRRFKTKLIALAMNGVTRIVVEPSGIFDTEEFFDILHEEPLDRMCEAGAVIAVADPNRADSLSESSRLLLAAQAAQAGAVVISRADSTDYDKIAGFTKFLRRICEPYGGLGGKLFLSGRGTLSPSELDEISRSGYNLADLPPNILTESRFSTLYLLNTALGSKQLRLIIQRLFTGSDYGGVLRVKGFFSENGGWYELNALSDVPEIAPIAQGQDVVIVIGEDLNEKKIKKLFNK